MGSQTPPRTIDWNTAQRIGELVGSGSLWHVGPLARPPAQPAAGTPAHPRPSSAGVPARTPDHSVQDLAHEFARRVGEYTGLDLPDRLPPLEMVDRPTWIAANLLTMRPLLDRVVERLGGDDAGFGPLRAVSGHLLGAQLGAVTGVLSQRVLGQYDVSLVGPPVTPRLLLLEPNLAAAARNLGVDRGELTAWVAIHEITHAVQFAGAPWLRGHLGGLLEELLAGLQLAGESDPGALFARARSGDWRKLLDRARAGDLRRLLERVRQGELLRLGLGEERWELVERLQAAMSLIEGHAEHTMDAVGREVLPSLPRLRAAMARRRESRGLPWRVLEKLLGLELKMRQYEVGRRFCDAVVREGGPQTLTLAWRSPRELPSAAELEEPRLWLARVRVAA